MVPKKSICLVGLENIPVLAPEYNHHRIGGEQVQQTLIAKALARDGYDVSMVVGDYGQRDGHVWDHVTAFKAYPFTAGLPVLRFFHPRLTGMWAALKRANADVYYTSCAGMQLGVMAYFTQLYGRRLIFRTASDSDCEPENLLLSNWRDKKLYEYGLRKSDYILTQSEKQRAAMSRNYHRESTVAGMLVEQPKRIATFAERDIPVLWVSNFRQLKRPDLMLALARDTASVQMHMAGGPITGMERIYEDSMQQAAQMPNMVFHGQVAYHDVGKLYERARLFVNTSDIEGFPNSYLQSWIHGTPVIAYFDPDSIIAREGLGRCVTTPAEMQAAVLHYLHNPDDWEQTSQRCIRYMQDNFGEDRVLAPYIDAMNRPLERSGSRS